ncbi:MAG TPA: hypothetical protein VIZ43_08540 [Trebonia sp.]
MSETNGKSYPQPHEGITGTLRDQDDLLSLEGKAVAVRKMMAGLASVLRNAVMVGQPAPVVQRMSERMRDPQPGDLVTETSTMGRKADDWFKGFGILIAHRLEWWTTDAEWEQSVAEERACHEEFLRGPYAHPGDADEPWEPDERLTDHAWYVQYGPGPGDVCRWVNCEFTVVPTDRNFAKVPFGTRDGSSVTIDRDGLLGSLADSGFALRSPK